MKILEYFVLSTGYYGGLHHIVYNEASFHGNPRLQTAIMILGAIIGVYYFVKKYSSN